MATWRILIDEDFRLSIVLGLLLRVPHLDIVRVLEAGLSGTPDPDLLAWAAQEKRIIFSHDTSTMPEHAKDRILAGETVTGVVVIQQNLPVGQAIEALEELVCCSEQSEWENLVLHLPL